MEGREVDDDIVGINGLNLLRIAYTVDPGGGGVYIGLNPDNLGKIYKSSWDFVDEEDGAKVIAEDLDEFIYGIKSVPITLNNIDFSQLYKNWGEDFWRVRE